MVVNKFFFMNKLFLFIYLNKRKRSRDLRKLVAGRKYLNKLIEFISIHFLLKLYWLLSVNSKRIDLDLFNQTTNKLSAQVY